MKVGDKVLSKQKEPSSSNIATYFEANQPMIIQDYRTITCKCGTWHLYWTGYRREQITQSHGITCGKCKQKVIDDNKVWLSMNDLIEIGKKEVDLERVEAQLDLLKNFAKGHIKNVSFEKILDMLDGDPEMLELGKQLLEQKKNE